MGDLSPARERERAQLAQRVRWLILSATTAAGSGHPTSSLSAVELMVGLFFGGHFRADLTNPRYANNDRLVFSKGHAAPLLYALYSAAGKVSEADLKTLRKANSNLEGHPMPRFRYADVPTGSLGQGLSVAAGMALNAKLERLPYRTFVLLGDSEMAEGSVWEAIQFAAFRHLDNVTAILDVNRLGQSGPTMLGHNLGAYSRRVASFGWKTIELDGHDRQAVERAYRQALAVTGKPTMLIAKTIKGKGISFLENKEGWHGRTLTREQLVKARQELGNISSIRGSVSAPKRIVGRRIKAATVPAAQYTVGERISPRLAVGRALTRLAPGYPQLMVLDGEVKNSTFTDLFAKRFPKQFIEAYIAEQNMAGVASGLASRGKLPVAATFASFWARAHDQLRMAQYAGTHQVFIGTHAGVSVGQDGASQMGLEDIALFRTLQNATVLYPADALAAEKLLERSLKAKGLVYLRATRADLPVLYRSSTAFPIGGSQTLRSSPRDCVTIVAAGVTLHEALAAAEELKRQRLNVRVIDLYSIQPIDQATLRLAARQTKQLVVVEDHVLAGGMSEAVRSALGGWAGTVTSLAVRRIPHSATPVQALHRQQIDAAAIIRTVKRLVKK